MVVLTVSGVEPLSAPGHPTTELVDTLYRYYRNE
jgi:hypothetical protein